MRVAGGVVLALLLAACSQQVDDAPDPAPGEKTVADTTGAEPVDLAVIDLLSDGIVVPARNGIPAREVRFGATPGEAMAVLDTVAGARKGTDQPNDCGLTTTSYEGLALHFRDGHFVGYWANAPYVPDLSRAEMLEDPAVSLVEDSTIDGEFTIERDGQTIAGLFVGDETRALWAGENCIAR